MAAAEFYQQNQQWETAKNLLAQVDSNQTVFYQKATALKGLLDLQSIVFEGELTDPDRQFQAGCNGVLAQQYEQALEIFLEMVGNDRKYRNDGARKAMITLFDFLGDDHELTRTYRKKLTRLLY
jgi:putative thioredoxin